MAGRKRSGRSRRGTGTVVQRGDRVMAQIDLGTRTDGMRDRRSKSFDTCDEAEAWLLDVRSRAQELTGGVAEQPLAEYLRWWIEAEAPKGKPGRPPLAATTLRGYRSNIERHIIPALGKRKVGDPCSVRPPAGDVDRRTGLQNRGTPRLVPWSRGRRRAVEASRPDGLSGDGEAIGLA